MDNEKDTAEAEMHVNALDKTRTFFKSLDLRALDEMRVGLELAPEQLGVVIDVYLRALEGARATKASGERAMQPRIPYSRRAMPMSMVCEDVAIQGKQFTVTQTVEKRFRPERMFIAPPIGETAAAWIIHDVRVDDETQLAQSGDLPGDMFGSSAIDSFVSFNTGVKFEIVATYIGERSNVRFFGGFLGTQEDAAKESAAEV